jgi:hypothetical protein
MGGTEVVDVRAGVAAVGPVANDGTCCCAQADNPKRKQMQISRLILIITIGSIVASCSPSFPTQSSTTAELASIVINYPVSGIRLAQGSGGQFEAYAVDTDGVYLRITNDVTWTSSDTSRLLPAPGRPGVISIGPPGNADLQVVYKGILAALPIEIRSLTNPRLQIQFPASALASISVSTVSATGGFNTIANTSVTWSSSDESRATVDAVGKVTTHIPGAVRITATRDGFSPDSYWMSVPPRSK